MGATSTFLGREGERDDLAALLDAHRLVTVTGPGGIGKTRLAAETCQVVADRYPGGVRRAELSPIPPSADIAVAVAGQLGFPTAEALAVGVGEQPSLLVLDNCEHVLAGAAGFAAELLEHAPEMRVLATSRAPLGLDGERVLVLGPLALPEADDPEAVMASSGAQLYLDRAKAAGAAWEPTVELVLGVGELCRRLDGIPLAIELAAARARTLSPTELLAHLDRRLDLLKRREGAGPARHGSLRAAIATSYELLEDGERAMFRRLAAFGGPFTAGFAHDVCAAPGTDTLDTLDLLASLVDRSMLVAETIEGTTRYRLLDSLRDFARERLDDAGEAPMVEEAFVARMVQEAVEVVAEALQSWSASLLGRLDQQFRNLVAALDWAVAHDDSPARAYLMLIPLYGAVHQARFHEVAAVGRRVFERWDEPGPGRSEALAVVAVANLGSGDLDRARALAQACVDDPAASSLGRLMAERVLGFVARAQGDLAESAAHFRAARGAAAGAPAFDRDLAVSEASVVGAGGDIDEALAMLDAVVTEAGGTEDFLNEARARIVAGALLVMADRRTEARAEVERAEKVSEAAGYGHGQGSALRLRAVVVALDDGWEASPPLWQRSMDLFAGDLREAALTLRLAAGAARRAGRPDLARELLETAPAPDWVTVQLDIFGPELESLPAAPGRAVVGGARSSAAAIRQARALLDAGVASEVATMHPPASPAPTPPPAAMVRRGDVWETTFAGHTAQIRHVKGLVDLVVLLGRPEQEVHCLELIGAADVGGSAGPALDDRARRAYQQRIRELQEEVDEAQADNDPVRAERAETELDALVEQLSAAFGIGGRARSSGSAAERARSAVTWRIRSAIRRIEDLHPELGRHLRNAVRTGTWCAYRPEAPVEWELSTRDEPGRSRT